MKKQRFSSILKKCISTATSLVLILGSFSVSGALIKARAEDVNYPVLNFENGTVPAELTFLGKAKGNATIENGTLRVNSASTEGINTDGFYQTVTVEPNTTYEWTFRVNATQGKNHYIGVVAGSTVNVSNNVTLPIAPYVVGGSTLKINDNTSNMGCIDFGNVPDPNWKSFDGNDKGWRQMSVLFTTQSSTTSVCLAYVVRSSNRNIYFDDWTLAKSQRATGTVMNGDFENGTAGFTNSETSVFEVITDPDDSTNHVLYVSGNATRGKGTVEQGVLVEPNTDYIWKFRHKVLSNTTKYDVTTLYVLNDANTNIINGHFDYQNTTSATCTKRPGNWWVDSGAADNYEWIEYGISFNSGSSNYVTLKMNAWAATRYIYLDDWSLEKVGALGSCDFEDLGEDDRPAGFTFLTDADDTAAVVVDAQRGKVLTFDNGATYPIGLNTSGFYKPVAVVPNTDYVWTFWMNNTKGQNHYIGVVAGSGILTGNVKAGDTTLTLKRSGNTTLPIKDIAVVEGSSVSFATPPLTHNHGALIKEGTNEVDSNWKMFDADNNGWKKVSVRFNSGTATVVSLSYIARAADRTIFFDDWSCLPDECIANGSFDNGLAGYQTEGGISVDTNFYYQPENLHKIQGGKTNFAPMLYQEVAVETYQEYEWTFRFKSAYFMNNLMINVRAGDESGTALPSVITSSDGGYIAPDCDIFTTERNAVNTNSNQCAATPDDSTTFSWHTYTVRFYSGSRTSVLLTMNPVNYQRIGYTDDWSLSKCSVLRGDADKDGTLGAGDLVAIRKWLLFGTGDFSFVGNDANSDGVMDIRDLIRIKINLSEQTSVVQGYNLVWSDDFNTVQLNNKNWNLGAHMSAQTDIELRYDASAVKVQNGAVNLMSGRVEGTTDKYYTNASLATDQTMIFKYGYVEMRAKVPAGKPAFPSFWMKSKAGYRADESVMGEIDIFENFGTTGTLSFACHNWGSAGHSSTGGEIKLFSDKASAEQWHTYGLLWTADALKYYIDGVCYYTLDISGETVAGKADLKSACFNDYYYLIMNNYLLTPGYGKFDQSRWVTQDDVFPITYSIDYVRLYKKPGEGDIIRLS